MIKQKNGSIINISSSAAIEGNEGRIAYASSKSALITLSKVMSKELSSFNIRVNAIAPGLIADNEDMSPKKRNEVLEKTPLGRLATRKEIAEVLYSICGPSFDSVTGQTIIIDGGFNLGQ